MTSSSCGLGPSTTGNLVEHGRGVRQEPPSSVNTNSTFKAGRCNPEPTQSYWRNIVSQWYDGRTGYSISEVHLEKFPDSVDTECWKVNFKTELCADSPCPTITMSWIKEVERANLIYDHLTSESIEGKIFDDFEMLDAKIASAPRKIL